MFLRSMNNVYQIIEPLSDFGSLKKVEHDDDGRDERSLSGWRREKSYFLASKTDAPSDERYLIIWVRATESNRRSISFLSLRSVTTV